MFTKPSVIATPVAGLIVLASFASSAFAADPYKLDPAHTSIVFRIKHAGISQVYGRFNMASGEFAIDEADPAKSTFALTLNAASIDTGVQQRDDHLRSPDFFDVKQYPAITFKSTAVKPVDGGYDVTGDLTMHGVTKPISLTITHGGKAEFPKGTQRIGLMTELTVQRKDFGVGIEKFDAVLGNDVTIMIGIEAVKQ